MAGSHIRAQSYCRRRCISSIWTGLGGLALLLLGAVGTAAFWQELTTGWEREPFETAALVGGLIFLLVIGIILCYVGIQNVFFPEKSALACSIRSQLPYPDEAPGWEELFAMVDRDLAAGRQWFGRFCIGKEWTFGDTAMRIDRIRGIFHKMERHHHRGRHSRTTTYTYHLVLIDDRGNEQEHLLQNEDQMMNACRAVWERTPNAVCGGMEEYNRFVKRSEEQKQLFEQQFEKKESERLAAAENQRAQRTVFTLPDGEVTSRVTPALLAKTVKELRPDEWILLAPTETVMTRKGAVEKIGCICLGEGYGVDLFFKTEPAVILQRVLSRQDTLEVLTGFLKNRFLPSDLENWKPAQVVQVRRSRPAEGRPIELYAFSTMRGPCEYDRFERADVEIWLGDLARRRCKTVQVTYGPLFMRVEAGDENDGRATVSLTKPEEKELRFFTTKASDRQAKEWMLAFYDRLIRYVGQAAPGWEEKFYEDFPPINLKEWKDDTRRMQREIKKQEKATR